MRDLWSIFKELKDIRNEWTVEAFKSALKEPPRVVMGSGIKGQVGSGNAQLNFDFVLLA